jgi:hypothetical protein
MSLLNIFSFGFALVVPLPLLGVTRMIFAISAIIWFLLCLRSGKILEKEE